MPKRDQPARMSEAKRLRKLLAGDGGVIPEALPASLKGQAGQDGESVFAGALRTATAEHIARVERVAGPLDLAFYVDAYGSTKNPLWLWMGLTATGKPGDIPPETFRYLKRVAADFLEGVLAQVQALERVRITPGKALEEGLESLKREAPPSPDIVAVLGLSSPGRNLFQAAARDFQAMSAQIAIKDLMQRTGCSQEEAHTALAIALGRGSPEAGPSTEAVRRIAAQGRKLLRKRAAKASG